MINKIQNYSNLKIILFLALAYPVSLISGPLIPELIILIFFGIFLISIKNLKKESIFNYNKNFIYSILIFNIYLILTSIFVSDYLILSLKNSLFYFRFLVLVLFLNLIIFYNCEILRYFLNIFIIILIFLSIDSAIQSVIGINLLGFEKPMPNRISSLFGDEEILGSYTIKLFPFFLSSILIIEGKDNLRFYLILILSFFLITASGERTAFILYVLFFLSLVFIKEIRIKIISISILFFLSFSLLYTLKFNPVLRIVDHTIHQVNEMKSEDKFFTFSLRHELHYFTSFLMFKQKPLFGAGPNTFRKECSNKAFEENIKKKIFFDNVITLKFNSLVTKKNDLIIVENQSTKKNYNARLYKLLVEPGNYKKGKQVILKEFQYKDGCNTHPHNIFFQFIGELGLIGLLFLMLFYIFIITKIIKLLKKNTCSLSITDKYSAAFYIILVSIFINFFPFSPYGNFFNNWNSMSTYFVFSLYFYLNRVLKI